MYFNVAVGHRPGLRRVAKLMQAGLVLDKILFKQQQEAFEQLSSEIMKSFMV